MKRTILALVNCLLLICFTGNLFSQNLSEREKNIFLQNVNLYRGGNFQQAEQNFALVITKLPDSPLLTSNYLMLVKSQYKLGDYSSTIEHAKKFLGLFPESSYRDDVLLTLGNSYFKLDRFRTAAKTWINALEVTEDPRMKEKIETMVNDIIVYKLGDSEIQNLTTDVAPSIDGQMLIAIAWAEKNYKNGANTVAQARLTDALQNFSMSAYSDKAKRLLASGGYEFSPEERFGLLLPLSGLNDDIGNDIFEGVQLAISEYNEQHNLNLQIAIKDYGEEITRAINAYKELAQNKNILAVVGPVENDITAACAAISAYERMPLLSPTATQNGLTNFSNYFYQLNSTINIYTEGLARYALDSLKISRFATFAPIDDHFIKMVNRFNDTVEKSGGEVVTQEWYYPGDQDFYKQFMKIKRVGLKLSFADSLLKNVPDIAAEQLDSLYSEYVNLEIEKINEKNTKIDSADIPVSSIPAIFIPIYKEDLEFIAPQIAYSNIQAQFLGNNDWYDLDQLKKNKNYINGIVFGSDGYFNEESWDFRQFRNEFRNKFKKSPTIYSLIGYDSFKYILQAYDPQNPNMDQNQFLRNLNQLNKYNGIYRTINLNKNRFNQSFQLLKYNYGQIIPLN